MFEVAAKKEILTDYEDFVSKSSTKKKKKGGSKQKNVTQDTIAKSVNKWYYIGSDPTRNELIKSLCDHLELKGLKAKIGCIPAILVQGKFPIEVIKYASERDVFELLGRMLWINEQYRSVIGVLQGVEDPDEAEEIEQSCKSLFLDEEKAILILV